MTTIDRATLPSLTDAIIVAVSRLVDDAQADHRRDPSHSDLSFLFERAGLASAELPTKAGKEKRVRQVLSWALEHDVARGEQLVAQLLASIRGCGGFRLDSPNYVGSDAVSNARAAFGTEAFELTVEGELRPQLLSGMDDPAVPVVLRSYIRRAARGSMDAALVVGTGKDLLEATAAYVLVRAFGMYNDSANFPTLLGQAFAARGFATPEDKPLPGEASWRQVERRMFEAACAVNRLRNKEGTGHGRPFMPSVTDAQARVAIQVMGAVGDALLTDS